MQPIPKQQMLAKPDLSHQNSHIGPSVEIEVHRKCVKGVYMGKLSSLLKLKPFVGKAGIIFWIGISGMILSSIISTPVPYFIGRVLDTVLVKNGSYSKLYGLSGVIALLYVLRYITSIASKYIIVKVSNSIVNEIRFKVMDKVIDLPMSYLSKTEKGYVQSRISECGSVGSLFSPMFIGLFIGLLDSFLALITIFALNYKLSILILLLCPLFFFSAKISAKKISKTTTYMLESSAFLNAESFEILNGMEDIKVLNGKESHLTKFRSKLESLLKHSISQGKNITIYIENINLINNFGTLLILLISGILILEGQFTIGLYTAFSIYVSKIFMSTQGVATLGTILTPICLSIERLYELLDMKDENSGDEKYLQEEISSISIRNMNFSYDGNAKNVINSLNLELRKGDKILVKGENGSGKTTLIKLLLGLYNPTSGVILYNNISTEHINIKSIRERIGIVSQNIFLFRGTVLDNILYGQTGKSREDVVKLIKDTNLESYINRLPGGLDTEINQNTSGISGGQMQIIAFIRATLSKKDIIILDEPISNVGIETRKIIFNLIGEKDLSNILIIISHQTEEIDFITETILMDNEN